MKTKSLAILLTLLAGGCIVQSFNPFFTDDSKTEMPQVTGQWNLLLIGDKSVEDFYPAAWTFDTGSILTHDEEKKTGKLDVTYFKVKDTTFVDMGAGEPATESNVFWGLHIIPVHSVCKVELKDNALVLRPLSYKWLDSAVDDKKVSLPFTQLENDHRVYTADTEAWQKFLAQYAADTNAFPDDIAYTFKKCPAPSPSQPATPPPPDSPKQ